MEKLQIAISEARRRLKQEAKEIGYTRLLCIVAFKNGERLNIKDVLKSHVLQIKRLISSL